MDIDETRYVLMSRDMMKNHDFMTLYLNGEYFFEKPPLYFWIECIFFKFFGYVNEFSARFPAALSGMILCYVVYFTGKKFISSAYGIVSSLVLATCLEYTILSKYAILDIYLCFFTGLSVFSYFWTHIAAEKNKKYFWWLFYLLCALPYVKEETEAVLHPSGNPSKPFHYAEYQALIDKEVKEKIEQSDINLVNFQYEQKADLDR